MFTPYKRPREFGKPTRPGVGKNHEAKRSARTKHDLNEN